MQENETKRALEWAFALLIGAAGAVVFLFQTFETVSAADSKRQSIEQRLGNIETKQDQLLNRQIETIQLIGRNK